MRPIAPCFWTSIHSNEREILLPGAKWITLDSIGNPVVEMLKVKGGFCMRVRIPTIFNFNSAKRRKIIDILAKYGIRASRKRQNIVMASNMGYWLNHIDPNLINIDKDSVKHVKKLWKMILSTRKIKHASRI